MPRTESEMQFIFSTGSLYNYGLGRCFEVAAQSGFDGMELLVDQRWDTRQPDYLKRLVDRYGLPIIAVHSPFFFPPGWPEDQPSLIQKSIELAEAVGARIVVHHLPLRAGFAILTTGTWRATLPIWGWDRDRPYRDWLLNGYQALPAGTDVTLCIENLPARRFLNLKWSFHHWNTVEAITRFPSLTMDTTHLGTWGLEPVEVYARWREKINHIHLSNFDGREHCRPEQGVLHLDRLLAQLATDGYQGAIALELHPEALEAGSSDDRIVELLRASLAYCRIQAGEQ